MISVANVIHQYRESELEFFKTLESKLNLVHLYENLNLLKYAADIVPTEELNMKATLKLSMTEDREEAGENDFRDFLLLELLHWFKFSFFSWVDAPKCELCQQIPQKSGFVLPNETEKAWLASKVENYFCTNCKLNIRFPRYNHPKKLLETRRGRCGEWANCFTFLCRVLGYDARIVFDWNDHAWTEVFSFSKNRWLHCDPCENVCDKPLLYEIGWKKPITYIMAFSKDEVQDVTWRYTSNFRDVSKRRNLCREYWLVNCILSLTEKLQMSLTSTRKGELTKRRVAELVDFLTEPKVEESLSGRTSGSIAWRLARGEVHDISGYIFKLNREEVKKRHFYIKYCCASDKYIRVSDHLSESDKWHTCAYNHNNIIRKEELDWKMVYLARSEGSSEASISWKFDFHETGLAVDTLRLHLKSVTFESGIIKWLIKSENISQVYDEAVALQTQDFKGCRNLVISAVLTEGKDNLAWQHTQLFRQPLDSMDFPLEVEIHLETL